MKKKPNAKRFIPIEIIFSTIKSKITAEFFLRGSLVTSPEREVELFGISKEVANYRDEQRQKAMIQFARYHVLEVIKAYKKNPLNVDFEEIFNNIK